MEQHKSKWWSIFSIQWRPLGKLWKWAVCPLRKATWSSLELGRNSKRYGIHYWALQPSSSLAPQSTRSSKEQEQSPFEGNAASQYGTYKASGVKMINKSQRQILWKFPPWEITIIQLPDTTERKAVALIPLKSSPHLEKVSRPELCQRFLFDLPWQWTELELLYCPGLVI